MSDVRRLIETALTSSWSLTTHHTQSYRDCIDTWVPRIIQHSRVIQTEIKKVTYGFVLQNYRFRYPKTSPEEALRLDESYTGQIVVDVEYFRTTPGGERTVVSSSPNILLCQFPVMLGLKEQRVAFSGSFIVNGKQVYIPLIKSVKRNFPLRLVSHKNGKYVQVRSEHPRREHRSTSTCELIMPYKKGLTRFFAFVRLPFIDPLIPIIVIVLALGGDPAVFFAAYLRRTPQLPAQQHKFLKQVFFQNNRGCGDRDSAQLFVARVFGKQRAEQGAELLCNEFLPHLNPTATPLRQKLYLLQTMYAHLTMFQAGLLPATDRDSVVYSRIITSGWSLAQMFRSKFLAFTKRCGKLLRQALKKEKKVDIKHIFNHDSLSRRIHSSIARGVWSAKRKGISRQLVVTNNFGVTSQLRLITTPHLAADGKHMKSRMIQPSSHGYLCAADTPNGEGCGLIHSMALFTAVTSHCDADLVNRLVRRRLAAFIDPESGAYPLFGGDGSLLGFVRDRVGFVRTFRAVRLRGGLDFRVSITQTHDALWVMSASGRLVRALVPPLDAAGRARIRAAPPTGLADLLAHRCIQFIAPGEMRHLRSTYDVGQWSGENYLEVNDVVFVGFIPALSPFFRHNQGPRLAYWSGMSKQQICGEGVHSNSGSATEHTLWYAQKPLIQTQVAQALRMDRKRTCINATVAIFALPDNQEDALVVNRAALERGMFTSTSVRTYSTQKRGRGADQSDDIFEPPGGSHIVGKGLGSSLKLQANGLPKIGARIDGGEAVIGLTVPTKKKTKHGRRVRRDKSVYSKPFTFSKVVSTLLVQKATSQLAKVRLAQTEHPQVGDKLSSRHAQKGTIGEVRRPEDMIFSAQTGMVPDLVMLPQGNFSRMTVGQILEMLCGKASCVAGRVVTDDQIFATKGPARIKLMGALLRQHGFIPSGNEVMVDGITGQQITCPIFVGVVSYTKLYHMVAHKLHARATGPVNWLTRQPTEGRRRRGGLRLGLMELDCLVSHGASALIKERTFDTSDPSWCFVCAACGHRAIGNLKHKYFHCSVCGHGREVKRIKSAHVTQLFCQEIQAIGIKTQFKLTPTKDI